MKKKYFGTDGIRGKFGEFPIVKDFFFKLALSLKKTKKETKKILIGKDTRVSGDYIESSLRDGFKHINVECDFIGIVSTPIISFYTKFSPYITFEWISSIMSQWTNYISEDFTSYFLP